MDNYEFMYCFRCGETVGYDKEEFQTMKRILQESGGVWWKCPVCGVKDYFEDVWRSAK